MNDNEVKLEKAMKGFNCMRCSNRTDVTKVTNLGTQCRLGYKQNPKTVASSRKLLANGGKLCLRHPLKYIAL